MFCSTVEGEGERAAGKKVWKSDSMQQTADFGWQWDDYLLWLLKSVK